MNTERHTRRWTPVAGLLVTACGAVACSGAGTDLNRIVNVDPLLDAGAAIADGAASEAGPYQDPFGDAPPFAAQTGSSSHNAGKSCMQSGCHGSSSGAPHFLIGGTVYKDYQGAAPAVGVEVRVVDPSGNAASAYSGPEGNFYIESGISNGVTFPAAAGARDGTTTRPMVATLTSSMGSCGQSTCHVTGGGPATNTGDYYPIHVP